MKKILFILPVLLFVGTASYGQQTVSRLFSDFSDSKGVERVDLGKFTMKIAGFFGGDTKGVDGVEVLSFNNCDSSLKVRLDNAVRSLKDENYETFLTTNEDGVHTKILMKIDDDTISELVVLTTGRDPALVRIKGKISQSDIGRMVGK
ncbi:MAG: DUF4252 domain-containing protein [Tannerella sp.]|jgi:hypothetical protein|nr:DUF4252 domain-containing protein [Tannerella sp.]